jgi:L-amino acid N-acyltransferase YncA
VSSEGDLRFVVREALPERDAAACLAIYAPYVSDTAISFEEEVPSVAEFAERIRGTLATHPWLVLEDSGALVGFAYASRHRIRAAYRWAADVTVYVASSHHRLGVGRRLYSELLERLRDRGFRVACAGITLPNEASVGLHVAMGFRPVGVYRGIGWKISAWHDVGWWQLDLAPPEPPPGRAGLK